MTEEDVFGSDGTTPVSGLVVPFRVPPSLVRLRRRWDFAALAGAGAHVTVLFPFLPYPELDSGVRAELASIAGRMPSFEVRFERVRRFTGLVWIEPEPAQPFAALTAAIAARWPDHPPYGGMFETVIPHLTVVESDGAPLDAVEEVARNVAPFTGRAERLELWCQNSTGRWRPRWRMPFGVRP
jgi:hypothetical protein